MKPQITQRNKPLTRKLTIRMTEDDWVLIDTKAQRKQQSISDFAREAINKHLSRK